MNLQSCNPHLGITTKIKKLMAQHSTIYVEPPNVWHQKLATNPCFRTSFQNFHLQIGKLPNFKCSPLETQSCRKLLIVPQYGWDTNSQRINGKQFHKCKINC